jgi:hypothetical protein
VARVLDNPRAINQHPAAATVLATLLDKLRSASARGRRGGLWGRAGDGGREDRGGLAFAEVLAPSSGGT